MREKTEKITDYNNSVVRKLDKLVRGVIVNFHDLNTKRTFRYHRGNIELWATNSGITFRKFSISYKLTECFLSLGLILY